jgi:hypothetical protein
MLLLEHLLLGFKLVLSSIIDDVPREIRERLALSKVENTEENKEKRKEMIVKAEKSKAYENLLNIAHFSNDIILFIFSLLLFFLALTF